MWGGDYKVLVLDARTTRVFSAALRMYDVVEEGLAVVELLEKARQPLPELEAIYFLEPSAASVRGLVSDFANPKKPQYKRVHLYFSRHASDEALAPIKAAPALLGRIVTFIECNLDFLAIERNVFHFDMKESMSALYAPSAIGSVRDACTSDIVERLVTVCATLNEYPFVRYCAGNTLTKKLAESFQAKINDFIAANSELGFRGDGKNGDPSMRATLIFLGRSDDVAAPLLHEFTYQAMVYDMLDIEDQKITWKGAEGGDGDPSIALLNEHDDVWVSLRHLHVKDVIRYLEEKLKSSMQTSIGKLRRGEHMDVEELRKAVKSMPEYSAMMAKHEQHTQMTQDAMSACTTRCTRECANLEQAMVTGVDDVGASVCASSLLSQLLAFMKDPSVKSEEKFRLLAVYVITQEGIKAADRKRCVDEANPPLSIADQNAIINLRHLGVTMQKSGVAKRSKRTKAELEKARQIALKSQSVACRYRTAAYEVCDDFINGILSKDYPYIYEPPPAAAQAPGRARRKRRPNCPCASTERRTFAQTGLTTPVRKRRG